jgi:hypothetical protein
METNFPGRLHYRCGTCSEIFGSLEELCGHAHVHARLPDVEYLHRRLRAATGLSRGPIENRILKQEMVPKELL